MTQKDKFTETGFCVVEMYDNTTTENNLVRFLKENYPQVIRDGEINLTELKAAAGLQIDEKVNGYGLNFIGRNVARAKYAQKTAKELKVNKEFSKNFDTTQNMILKGDNLDCLKILKSHYSGQIKCIYIDPPYNTDSDEFIYPDRFDKEEQEVLGLTNISESDFERLEFSFSTKKSHNGWLSFMYPRLLLARDLLAKDGVIFISIDDNEQANLKILCDEIFGEENLVVQFIREAIKGGSQSEFVRRTHDYVLTYAKNITELTFIGFDKEALKLNFTDDKGQYAKGRELNKWGAGSRREDSPSMWYSIKGPNGTDVYPIRNDGSDGRWRLGKKKMNCIVENNEIIFEQRENGTYIAYEKLRGNKSQYTQFISILKDRYINAKGTETIKKLFHTEKIMFDFSKPEDLIKDLLLLSNTQSEDIILDFFAGSGTTAHAVMQLNAEDGGSRKFILCQIDEPIKKSKPAYQFCVENNLPPVISSITVERLKRAGEKINKGDIGFKVFDLTDAPKLEIEDGQIVFQNTENDPLSRIYNMIFSLGVDDPTAILECIFENCVYKTGDNYYITNADELNKEENKRFLSDATKNGNVFIDGWTATINSTLQNHKNAVKVVF